MPFNSILNDLASRAGAMGAVLMDWDGERVASHCEGQHLEMDLIGAHHGIILNMVKEAAAGHEGTSSGLKSLSILTDHKRLVISTLKEGYFLLLVMEKKRPLGRAIAESEIAVKKIEEEMG